MNRLMVTETFAPDNGPFQQTWEIRLQLRDPADLPGGDLEWEGRAHILHLLDRIYPGARPALSPQQTSPTDVFVLVGTSILSRVGGPAPQLVLAHLVEIDAAIKPRSPRVGAHILIGVGAEMLHQRENLTCMIELLQDDMRGRDPLLQTRRQIDAIGKS